ncbi:MAG: hypothetical protein K9L61_04110, partial [Candidatus Omnitrophica bacterium]|nr:hypothetical protein [Candidatus Omnitrophota bacterium]
AISSFGLRDKDGAIQEFFPANKAYSLTPYFGFRTFIKDSKHNFYEPFSIEGSSLKTFQNMAIASDCLKLTDKNPKLGLETKVKYFTLPNQAAGTLARKVTFKNLSKKTLELKVLDGLARVIPYGASNGMLKDMSRTLEAWMHSYLQKDYSLFRLIVDPADVSQTTYIKGANFNYSFFVANGKKNTPALIVDPTKIFGNNLSYSRPDKFLTKSFSPYGKQVTSGKTPAAFSYLKLNIKPNQSFTLYNLFGAAFDTETIQQLVKNIDSKFLATKEKVNNQIIEEIKSNAFCLSGQPQFDNYLSSTYLDNILRGGFPYQPKGSKVCPYYIFSRKHGDPERDYNYFNLSPSYFSEGQGNYRDVNQNRRLDLFFKPSLGKANIRYFLNLSQIDGFNPLVVKGQKLYFEANQAKKILKQYNITKKKFQHLMTKGFYLGEFFDLLIPEDGVTDKEGLVLNLLKEAKRKPQASHGEGYWIDHWRYTLDLIENFLIIFPDKLEDLFFNTEFTFFDDKYKVKPRSQRYVLLRNKVYQGESIETDSKKAKELKLRKDDQNLLRSDKNKVYRTHLVEKLLVLILNKAASFDPDGLGLEMEADKPGWCDSVNGLPALFGSSLCETFELKRAALLLKEALAQSQPKSILFSQTVSHFFNSLDKLITAYNRDSSSRKNFTYWDKSNKLKENFRKNSFYQISAKKNNLKILKLNNFLDKLIKKIDKGLKRTIDKKTKLYPTYFTYQVTDFKKTNHHPVPLSFSRHNLPLFLEGIVSALRCHCEERLPAGRQEATKQSLSFYQNVKKSSLYDRKLKMYKLNESLAQESLDIGRSRIFTPGWLENESIWLHMEYKYLLELLKVGLYQQFFTEFSQAAICYQDPKIYGRNTLENSSFLASSRHPDKKIHGKGFVARLTGATAELLNIWVLLSLGSKPFSVDKSGRLTFSPQPILDKKMFTKKAKTINWGGKTYKLPKNTYSFQAFSKTLIIYHNPNRIDTFAKNCKIKKIELQLADQTLTFKQKVKGEFAEAIRNQEVTKIDIYLN